MEHQTPNLKPQTRKKLPTVSIIIPCYQQAKYLPEALESLLQQTLQDWEAIIINDASPDDTLAVVNAWLQRDARIRLVDLPENGGVCCARNAGITVAKGTYLLPLDADDTIAPTYLEKAVAILKAQPEIKLVYGKAMLTGTSNQPFALPPYTYRQHLIGNCIFNSALVRKADVDAIGGYDVEMKKSTSGKLMLFKVIKHVTRILILALQQHFQHGDV
jgi:glycosyltransferase involved in cell wall biosynthesis